MSAGGQAGADKPMPSFSEQLADQLGGVRGVVESSIPIAVFVLTSFAWSLRPSLGPALRPALGAAVGTAVVLAVYRLVRRESIRNAVNGLFGIFLGVAVAWKTGNAKDFYLPGILLSLGTGLAMIVSVLVRRPLVGWLWSVVVGGGSNRWREEPRLLRTFSWLTVLWSSIYLIKVAVQTTLYLTHQLGEADKVYALGIARLALGYPPYLMLLAVTVWAVRRATRAGSTDLTPVVVAEQVRAVPSHRADHR